jgi:hypothetical protein
VPVKNCWIKKVIVTCANFIWNFRLSSYTWTVLKPLHHCRDPKTEGEV